MNICTSYGPQLTSAKAEAAFARTELPCGSAAQPYSEALIFRSRFSASTTTTHDLTHHNTSPTSPPSHPGISLNPTKMPTRFSKTRKQYVLASPPSSIPIFYTVPQLILVK